MIRSQSDMKGTSNSNIGQGWVAKFQPKSCVRFTLITAILWLWYDMIDSADMDSHVDNVILINSIS